MICILFCFCVCLGGVPRASSLTIGVDARGLQNQLLQLATFSDDPNPAVTRVLFTENDLKARTYVKSLMRGAYLEVTEDTMGNIYGTLSGPNPTAAKVLTGSHIDAIPLAGAYDGTIGVIGGIAALKALTEAGYVPQRPLQVVAFTSEEPTRFALSCTGSRAMAGVLDGDFLDAKRDENGTSFLDAARSAGYGSATYKDMLVGARRTTTDLAAFVELHIEQGPVLELEGKEIGVVTAIAAPAALRVKFSGDGGHAGALIMPDRNDAGLAAAELALYVEKRVLATGSIDTVGTTGRWEISPNAVNSVPRQSTIEIDIRDIDGKRRDAIVADVQREAKTIAAWRKCKVEVEIVNQDPPATCGAEVVSAVEKAVLELGLSSKHMVSRAYHDSLFMAQIAPTGMIFIPCYKGYSHRPDEYASPEDIERGVRVLALTMARLAEGNVIGNQSHTEL